MTLPFRKTLMALAFSAISTLALADTPARVGRIALAQGPVNISSEVGEEATAALVNWPVTTSNQIVTQRNGRTEIRIGSTSVRLDGDSSLDVIELDDDTLRLHLHYGSLSLRVRNAEVLRGLEISTPQGLVRMKDVGRLRIDAERVRDTSNISVFEGTAQVDGGGSSLAVRAGKRVDVHNDDVRTALAVRDAFDDWSLQRDARDERTTSDRYVTTEMTGYEELDQYGAWREDSDYGPLWTPRSVAADWVPYRDGRWTYLAPWGWTWVDNAPWGYAPSHYGRWVMVRQRWSWAPGRNIGRPVWAPALVGWVGGNNWNLAFNDNGARRHAPAQGWYPLNPGESYVPGYHLPPEHLRHHNRHARPDYRPGRHDGLTVVGLNLFVGRGQIVVPRAPRPVLTPLPTQSIPFGAPPRPQGNWSNRFDRDGDGRPDRNGPGRVITVPSGSAQPALPFSRRDGRPSDNERFVRTPPQVLTTSEPQRSLAEKDRRQREAEIERRERDQVNERRLRELETDGRRATETQQRLREAELAERRREADSERQRGADNEQRQRVLDTERRQREAEAQLQGQRDALNRQQAERQQRDANNRQLADRLQRDADQERLRQVERQQQADRQQQAERLQQAERQQRDADNARRQQAERLQQEAENTRRQQAERQQAERQSREAENERRQQAERQQRDAQRETQQREAQQRDAQRETQQREAQQRDAQQRDAQKREAAQAQQAQAQQQQQQKQAEEADKRERAREQRQDRRDNVQQQIR